MTLREIVENALDRAEIPPRAPLIAAVSGGADSLALLHALCESPRLRERVSVGHVNHGLRPEAEDEARLVAQICERLEVTCHQTRLSPERGRGNLADRLRHMRYAFLLSLAGPEGFVLTAHHADDQAVTVLMRLIEGAALPGLAGIPFRRGQIVRPLLKVPRADLEAYLRARKVTWVEDPSNRDLRSFRNRVRWQILPTLVAEQPRFVRLVGAAAERLREDDAALDSWALSLLESARVGRRWVELDVPELPPTAVIRRVAEQVTEAPASELHTERLRRGQRLNLRGRWTLEYRKGMLLFLHQARPADFRTLLEAPGTFALPHGRLSVGDRFSLPAIARPLALGDRWKWLGRLISPFEWLADHGQPGYRRQDWPVLADPHDPARILAVPAPTSEPVAQTVEATFDPVLGLGLQALRKVAEKS